MFRKQITRLVPEGAPTRTRDGEKQVQLRLDGVPTWVRLNGNGRAVVLTPHYYAKISGKVTRLARDKNTSIIMLGDLRRKRERIAAGLELETDGDTTVAEALDGYLADSLPKRSAKYGKALTNRLRGVIDRLGVTRVHQLSGLRRDRIEAATQGTPNTKWHNVVALKAFLKWCVGRRLIGVVPEVPSIPQPKGRRAALSREDLSKLIVAADESRKLLYATAFSTLARMGALSRVTLDDCSFTVDGAGNPTGGTISLLAEHSKTGTAQCINVAPLVLLELFHHCREMREKGLPGHTRVFKFNPVHISGQFAKDLKAAGLPSKSPQGLKITPHSLRHGGTTHLLKHGVSPFIVMRLGGWKSMALLVRNYGHVISLDAKDALEQWMR
jgi:integrase